MFKKSCIYIYSLQKSSYFITFFLCKEQDRFFFKMLHFVCDCELFKKLYIYDFKIYGANEMPSRKLLFKVVKKMKGKKKIKFQAWKIIILKIKF